MNYLSTHDLTHLGLITGKILLSYIALSNYNTLHCIRVKKNSLTPIDLIRTVLSFRKL